MWKLLTIPYNDYITGTSQSQNARNIPLRGFINNNIIKKDPLPIKLIIECVLLPITGKRFIKQSNSSLYVSAENESLLKHFFADVALNKA